MSAPPAPTVVLAGGGVVVRSRPGRAREYAVVHRPRYDDWSLPKGKVDAGESAADAALREVEEETGIVCAADAPLGSVSYLIDGAARKIVRYWLMQAGSDGAFTPNDEVDQVVWLAADEARERLDYQRDRAVLDWGDQLARRRDSGIVYLVRHATAGRRRDWDGPDEERPVQGRGWDETAAISDTLAAMPVGRVLTSRYVRCRQTVAPLAGALDLPLEDDRALAEGAAPEAAAGLLAEIAGTPAVLCSHGDVVSDVIGRAAADGAELAGGLKWQKGSIWLLATNGGRVLRGRYLAPAR